MEHKNVWETYGKKQNKEVVTLAREYMDFLTTVRRSVNVSILSLTPLKLPAIGN